MRVLLLSNMYPSDKDKSYGVFVRNFHDGLADCGFQFDRVVIDHRSKTALGKAWNYLCFAIKARFVLAFRHYDVIYVHFILHSLIPLLFWKKPRQSALVLNAHGSDVISTHHERIRRWVRPIYSQCDLLVVPSHYFKDLVATRLPEFKNKIHVSPSGGIDLDLFYPKTSIAETSGSLLYVSRLDAGKGWPTLLHALKQLHQDGISLRLTVVGTGAQTNDFLRTVQELGLQEQVNVLGSVEQKALGDLYRQADAFVFPTEREAESLGLVGLEAMACGTPVIGSEIAGLKGYLVNEENGFFFQPGNSQDLARAIRQFFAQNTEQAMKMREACIHSAQQYDKKKVFMELAALLKERFAL